MTNVSPQDFLWGADAIAKAIGRSPRAVYHLLEAGELPARRVGGRWVSTRRALVEALSVAA